MKVCICNNICDRSIRNAVAEGASSLDDVRRTLGVGSQCGKCSEFASELIHESLAQQVEIVAVGATAGA